MTRKLILHAGMGKSGTTAPQNMAQPHGAGARGRRADRALSLSRARHRARPTEAPPRRQRARHGSFAGRIRGEGAFPLSKTR